jgi:hypothetical protein
MLTMSFLPPSWTLIAENKIDLKRGYKVRQKVSTPQWLGHATGRVIMIDDV